MRKLVAAAICLLSLSLSVTTGRKCIKEARTRTGKKCCEQQLRRVDKALSRAGDIPEGSWICLSHRNLILAEDKRSLFLQFLAHAQTFDRGVVEGTSLTVYITQNAAVGRLSSRFETHLKSILLQK